MYDIFVLECIDGDKVIFGATMKATKLEKSLASKCCFCFPALRKEDFLYGLF